MTRVFTVAALAALTLAACSKKPDDAAAPAPEAAAPAPAPAASATVMKPTPGKWRMSSAMEGMPAGMPALPATEVCYKAEDLADDAWATGGKKPANCSEMTNRVEGGAVVVHAVCSEQGITTTMDIRAAGDFSRRYTVDTTMKMSPAAPGAMNPMKITVTAERVGDC